MIFHLLFTHDSVFFKRATKNKSIIWVVILERYSKASGKLFNFNKFIIFLSKDVDR